MVTCSSLPLTVGLISVAQAPVHLCFQYFKKWKLCNISGPPAVAFNHAHCEDVFPFRHQNSPWCSSCPVLCLLPHLLLLHTLWSFWLHLLCSLPWISEDTNATLMSVLSSRLDSLQFINVGTLQHENCSLSLVPFINFLSVLSMLFFFFCEQGLMVPKRYCLGHFSATFSVWACDMQQTSWDC